MNTVSPFSLLDKIKPGTVASRARDVADAARDLRDKAPGRVAGVARDVFSDVVTHLDRNDNGKLDVRDAARLATHAIAAGRDLSGRHGPGDANASAPGSGEGGHTDALGDASKTVRTAAETVVTAGLAGLDLIARCPAERLALKLAQATYAAVRTHA